MLCWWKNCILSSLSPFSLILINLFFFLLIHIHAAFPSKHFSLFRLLFSIKSLIFIFCFFTSPNCNCYRLDFLFHFPIIFLPIKHAKTVFRHSHNIYQECASTFKVYVKEECHQVYNIHSFLSEANNVIYILFQTGSSETQIPTQSPFRISRHNQFILFTEGINMK